MKEKFSLQESILAVIIGFLAVSISLIFSWSREFLATVLSVFGPVGLEGLGLAILIAFGIIFMNLFLPVIIPVFIASKKFKSTFLVAITFGVALVVSIQVFIMTA